ncbi:MAG: alpha/beta fold hydrolase, partial [Deltaproteobacteria bacterium]|nr:alpha/beta fold hydrolase [Deltaproteobacteria bacterium]
FFSPRNSPLSEEGKRWLVKGEPFTIRVHEKNIQAWRWGSGPGVLFVHGWSGRGIQFHRFIDPLVRAGFTVIAFDGPAHGASDGRNTSYFEFTDVVRAFFDPGLGLDIRSVVAHSFGAAAVINGLVRQTDSPGTVLIAPALMLSDMVTHVFERHGVPPALYENLLAAYEHRFGYSLQRDDPHLHLKDLRRPALVIHDQDDPIVAYRDSRALSQQPGILALHTTVGLGHRKILADPDVVEATVSHLAKEASAWTLSNTF